MTGLALAPHATAAVTCFAASPRSFAATIVGISDLACSRIFRPAATLVPSRRTTSGTLKPTSFAALTMPWAMTVAVHDAAEDVDEDAL
jgi:hypothetical protein